MELDPFRLGEGKLISSKPTGRRFENFASSMFASCDVLLQVIKVGRTDAAADGFDVEMEILIQAVSQTSIDERSPNGT